MGVRIPPGLPTGEKNVLMFKKMMDGSKEFFSDVKAETKKVTFPTKEDTIGTTTVVFALVFMAAVYMWILDVSLSAIIAKILP